METWIHTSAYLATFEEELSTATESASRYKVESKSGSRYKIESQLGSRKENRIRKLSVADPDPEPEPDP
jgi:hypothetical protein